MKKDEYLNIIRKQIHFFFDRDAVTEELSYHLSDSIADLMEEGLSREEAEKQAVEQMGNPVEVGRLLNQEHHPVLGYLWMISNIVLILLIIPISFAVLSFGYGLFNMMTPAVMGNSIETIPIRYEVETPTHRISIDNICINEDGLYYLTYRAWTNWDYSRAGWSSDGIRVVNDDGAYSGGSRYSSGNFLGSYGYTRFELPEDGVLNVLLRDGRIIELELEDYR